MLGPLQSLKKLIQKRRARNAQMHADIRAIKSLLIDEHRNRHLYGDARYQNPKRLNKFEYQVYSQNGEDGIIEEIFRRIGTVNQFFVELGVQAGLECNTTHLLIQGWSGYWIEGDPKFAGEIELRFRGLLSKSTLRFKHAFITAENIAGLFKELGVPREFDLLSVDLDGNDYWVWKALGEYSPRAVVIEYNAMFRPNVKWVMKYNPGHAWDGTSYFNASLKSLELLGQQMGYSLVGCNFLGSNAFFVRQDLVADKFYGPFTAENHYEPVRYHLLKKDGFPRAFGDFENI